MKFFVRFCLLICLTASAVAVPNSINYQGRLLDDNGVPVTGTYTFKVTLWDDETASTGKLYEETHVVTVNDGVYSLKIGTGTPVSGSFSGSLFSSGGEVWLELMVDAETLTPRQELLPSPFTFQSDNSNNFGGNPPSHFATSSDLSNVQSDLQFICEQSGNYWDGTSCKEGLQVIPYLGKYIPVAQPYLFLATPDNCADNHYHSYGVVEDCDFNSYPTDPAPDGCGFGTEPSVMIILKSSCSNPSPNPAGQ